MMDTSSLPSISLVTIQDDISSLIVSSLAEKSLLIDSVSPYEQNLVSFLNKPAPNLLEWATRPEYLNFVIEDEDTEEVRTIQNHFGQYQTLRDFFELLCPICSKEEDKDCWNKSKESLESQPLLVWNSSYKDDECPRCKTTRAEFEEAGMFNAYDFLLALIGMRSGKSVTAAIIASFLEHKILTYNNPQKYFGQAPGQLLEASFVATTSKQSEKTVFEAWKGLRKNSPWIQNFISRIKSMEDWNGQYYQEVSKSIEYPHINIRFESFSSNSSGVAGGTRIASFIDELARFDTTESKRSAKEVYRVFNQGLRTIRSVKERKRIPNCFGILVATTSPLSATDYGMQLKERASFMKNMYYVHKSTWDFNPFEPRANFDNEFKADPVGAMRDFGAQPPLAETPYVNDLDAFMKSVDKYLTPTATFTTTYPKDAMGREYVGASLQTGLTDSKNEKIICGDAGKANDSYGLVMAHGEWRNNVWTTVYDFALAVRPTQSPKRIVFFDGIETIIRELAKKNKIKCIRFDHWASDSIIQSLRFAGLDADVFGLKVDQYKAFLSDAYLGKIAMLPALDTDKGKDPYCEMSGQGRVLHEITHLERSLDLKKVDHKQGEHNDLACCQIMAHHFVQTSLTSLSNNSNNNIQSSDPFKNFGTIAKFRRW